MSTSNGSTTPSVRNSGKILAVMKALRAGMSNLPAGASVTLGGVSFTVASIDAKLDAGIASYAAVETAKAAVSAAVATRDAAEPELKQFCEEFSHFLVSYFGKGSPMLASFGVATRKAGKASAAKVVAGNAQREKTREAHHVMGKRQRAALGPAALDGPLLVSPDGEVSPAPGSPSPDAANGATPPANGSK